MKIKIWFAVALCSTLFVLLGAGSAIGIMYSWWRQTAVNDWTLRANQTQRDVQQVMKNNLDFLRFAAASVPIFGRDPLHLTHMFRAYDDASPYTFGSIGAIQRAPNTTNGKYSWQLALGFGCTDYIYAYADATTPYPVFLGHCVDKATGTVAWTDSAYVGNDWGLNVQEAQLVDGLLAYTFLPVFNLLNQFTLTYELGMNGTAYFAELNLQTFSSYVANNVTGNVYIYETANGALIAATVAPVVVNGTRVNAATSTAAFISETYNKTQQGKSWLINTARYQDVGLDWTIVIVASDWSVYADLYTLTGIAVGIAVGVAIVCALSAALVTGCLAKRETDYLYGRATDPEHTPLNTTRFFDETERVAVAIEAGRNTVHL